MSFSWLLALLPLGINFLYLARAGLPGCQLISRTAVLTFSTSGTFACLPSLNNPELFKKIVSISKTFQDAECVAQMRPYLFQGAL